MTNLVLYAALDRVGLRNYRAKIMVLAFIGTHVPLISLLAYVAAQNAADWMAFTWTLGVAIAATVVGTGLTLAVLHHLLQPLSLTSRALRVYRRDRTITELPAKFTDEAGTLMADASETMAHLERAMDILEHVDSLTNLPNRKRMLSLIEQSSRTAEPFAVAVIHFSDHTRIAGTLDIARAQAATTRVAARLRDVLSLKGQRRDPVLGALSGSEFALLLPGIADAGMVSGTLLRTMREAAIDLELPGLRLRPTLTAGAAMFPADGTGAADLLDHAAAAAARAGLEAPVVLHSPDARDAAFDRYQMEQDLGAALAKKQLELHYQPVIDLRSRCVNGAEALLRWRHPERGMVPPAIFIPVAEASGLIDAIGDWVLHDACRQLGVWSATGRDLRLAVNLSGRQFADPGLHRRIKYLVTSNEIDATRLEIELTETAAMADHHHSRTVFAALRDIGLGIAIDDFGTGYASLSTLRSLPFTKLKIDREFVLDVHRKAASQAICEALLALSRGLNLDILAEGTENVEDVDFLHERGCTLFQGYHFARPLPASDFGAVVDELNASLRLSTTLSS